MDDLDALEKCAAHANGFLSLLSQGFDVWIGEDPEYPFDPSKSQIVFRETRGGAEKET